MHLNKVKYSLKPTEFYYVPKLVNRKDIPQLKDQTEDIVKVYISPNVLSYTLIDNIINLQHLFKTHLSLSFNKFNKLQHQSLYTSVFTGDLSPLLRLDSLNLYEDKFNKGSYRGGKRFLFTNVPLLNKINEQIKKSLPQELLNGFHSVNNVFRFNCFEPSDEPFHEHYDIPFVNIHGLNLPSQAVRTGKQQFLLISKYTLLIYLTAGKASPILSIENLKQFQQFDAGTCILFSHRHKHTGLPYTEGNKLFIRTQLVYRIQKSQISHYSEEVSRIFSSACYLTKQSIFDKELQAYSKALFTQFNQKRLQLKVDDGKIIYLLKQTCSVVNESLIQNTKFITDGANYYFSKEVDLKLCTALAIHDFFSAGSANKIVEKLVFDNKTNTEHIFQTFFKTKYPRPGDIEKPNSIQNFVNNRIIISRFFLPQAYQHPDCNRSCSQTSYQNINIICEALQSHFKRHKNSISMFLLDQYYVLNLEDTVINDGIIFFKESDTFRFFNFASCYCGTNIPEYLQEYFGRRAPCKYMRLPFIRYEMLKNCVRLSLDLYNNGFCFDVLKPNEPIETQVTVTCRNRPILQLNNPN